MTTEKRITVAIIEDVEDIRVNLKEYLEGQDNIANVMAAGSMEEFFEKGSIAAPPDVSAERYRPAGHERH